MVMLDIDSGKFIKDLPPNASWKKVLPPESAQLLKAALTNATKHKKMPQQLNLEISLAFLQFHYSIFEGYHKFIDSKFDVEGFKNSRNTANKKVS